MGPFDAFWHLLNFFGPAIGVGLLAPLLAKLLWRRELKGVSWRRLCTWTTGLGAAGLVAGLVLFGRDGKMAGYGVMLAACTASLWWIGFIARPK